MTAWEDVKNSTNFLMRGIATKDLIDLHKTLNGIKEGDIEKFIVRIIEKELCRRDNIIRELDGLDVHIFNL